MTVTNAPAAILEIGDVDGALDEFASRLARVLAKLSGGPVDQAVHGTILAAAVAFAESGGRPDVAATRVASKIQRIGAQEAQAGRRPADLHAAFNRLHTAVMGELSTLVGPGLVGGDMIELRIRTKKYLHVLCLHAMAGMNEQHRRLAHSRDRRRAVSRLSSPAVNGDRAGMVRAVVSIGDPLPEEVRNDPALHDRESAFEVLLPQTVDLEEFESRLTSPVVYGPLTSWADLPEAMVLVWRAASLVSERKDDRLLIPCDELAGELLVSGNGVLQNMLILKHLSSLESMSHSRRAGLSETLLHWLERGLPVNQLARDLGLAPQTLHSRIKTLRTMFGDTLDDPTERLELIIALRAVVPLWSRRAS